VKSRITTSDACKKKNLGRSRISAREKNLRHSRVSAHEKNLQQGMCVRKKFAAGSAYEKKIKAQQGKCKRKKFAASLLCPFVFCSEWVSFSSASIFLWRWHRNQLLMLNVVIV